MIRWFARVFYSFIVICLLLFIFLITPTGFRLSLNLVEKFIPGTLTYQHISGTIFGPINVSNLEYDNNTVHLSVSRAHLEWRLPMLLLKQLDLINFNANNIAITLKSNDTHKENTETTESDTTPSKLTLPFNLKIEKAKLTHLTLNTPKQKSSGLTAQEVTLNTLEASPQRIKGSLSAVLTKPYSLTTTLTFQGTLDDYKVNWTLHRGKDTLVLTGRGNSKKIQASLTGTEIFKANIQGHATLQWYPYWAWETNIEVQHLNLHKFYNPLPNLTYAMIKSKGTWKTKVPVFNLETNFNAPGTKILVKGKHGQRWNLTYSINSTNLHNVLPHTYGSLISQGTVKGKSLAPIIKGNFQIQALKMKPWKLKHSQGNFTLDLSAETASSLNVQAQNMHLPGLKAQSLTLKTKATPQWTRLHTELTLVNAKGQTFKLTAAQQGSLKNNVWQGYLSELHLHATPTGTWTLRKAAPLTLSSDKISVQQACWHNHNDSLCTTLDWRKQNPWSVKITGALHNLNLFTSFALPDLTITSPMQLNLNATGNHNGITNLQSQITLKQGTIKYINSFMQQKIVLNNALFTLNTKDDALLANASVHLGNKNSLSSHFKVSKFLRALNGGNPTTAGIEGKIQFNFTDFKVIKLFTNALTQPKGLLRGDLTLSGNLPVPNIQGTVSLADGDVEIPELKLKLTDINIKLIAKNDVLNYTVNAKAGNKPVTVLGKTSYRHKKLITHLALKGDNLLLIDTEEYRIITTLDLNLKAIGSSVVLTGKINVPSALLKPLTFSTSVSLPQDTIIITPEEDDSDAPTPFNWIMNLTLTLGKDVKIRTHGLKADLQGQLNITHKPDQPHPVATGQITFRNATFTAQGRTLTINPESNISYVQSPIANPQLSIRASRKVSVTSSDTGFSLGPTKTEVGIDIRGTVQRPNLSLYSTPKKLSQADILSYLLFDSPASGASAGSLTTILSTALSLNVTPGEGGDSSLSQLKQKLGISELGVEQQTYVDAFGTPLGVNQSSFVIGSYITPKIYVRYNRGLLSQFDIYEVRYSFNKNWSIQTETGTGTYGTGTGVDVLYTISRKKFPW